VQLKVAHQMERERRSEMNLFAMMETSGSAMQAERMRAEVVAANMANAETTRTAAGGPTAASTWSLPPMPGDPGF
jgi:flagellar basal body rod protein FlgC